MFKHEGYTILDLTREYPGYTGEVRWAVVSDIAEDDLMQREELAAYRPFVVLTWEQSQAITDFGRNRRKHRDRNQRSIDLDAVQVNPASDPVLDQVMYSEQVRHALEQLTDVQRRRLELHLAGYTCREIAMKEGVEFPTVAQSIEAAKKNLKKIFSDT